MSNIRVDYELDSETAEIDAQHRQIFDKLNSYLSASSDTASSEELIAMLDDVHDRLAAHFAYEESLLSETRQISTSHLSEHAQLSDRLKQCSIRLRDNSDNSINVRSVLLSVYDWYVDHLQENDSVFYVPERTPHQN